LNDDNAFEMQADIIHYVTIHEVCTSFLNSRFIPHYKHEKAENYRKIMKQVSLVQIDNSRDHIAFWSRVIDFHASQGEQRFPKPMWS